MHKAVIDIGSNSVRLVVYQQGPHGTQKELDNLKQTVRLSSHIQKDGNLSEEGIRIALYVLQQFKQLCDAYGVEEIICVATQAVRIAGNREEFVRRIEEKTGIRVRILSGEEEARYGYLAVVNTIPLDEGIAIDVGGGSTEITYFHRRRMQETVSIPLGAVNLTAQYLESDPPSGKEMKRMERAIQEELKRYPWLIGRRCPVIGVGGAARTIAKIHQAKRQYPLSILHTYQMWPYEVTGILEMLRSFNLAQRKEIPGLSRDRADIIIGGAVMIDQLLRWTEATQFIISNKGLRDGILIEEVLKTKQEPYLTDMLLYSIENNLDHFQMNREHAWRIYRLADQLFTQFSATGIHAYGEEEEKLLKTAALLHDVGRSISIYDASRHTFYLLLHIPLYGVTHRERILIAAIASYKNSKQISQELSRFGEFLRDEDLTLVNRLGTLLRFIRSLDRTETGEVKLIEFTPIPLGGQIRIEVKESALLQIELATEWLKKLSKSYQRELRLEVIYRGHEGELR